MKVNELAQDQIMIGMKILSLKDDKKIGTVMVIDHKDDDYAWILWDGDIQPYSGFYGNDCRCEVVEFGTLDPDKITAIQNHIKQFLIDMKLEA